MRINRLAIVLSITLLMIGCLTGCNKSAQGGGFFEDGSTPSQVTSDKKDNGSNSLDESVGGKLNITTDDNNNLVVDTNTDTVEDKDKTGTNTNTSAKQEEVEEWHEPEVVDTPVPTWANDNTYSIASLKAVDPDNENNDTYYVADKLYITINDDKVKAEDIDIEYTYTYGSLQPIDPEDTKEKDYILYLTEEYAFDKLTELKDQLDGVSKGFTVEIKSVNNVSSWISGDMPTETVDDTLPPIQPK